MTLVCNLGRSSSTESPAQPNTGLLFRSVTDLKVGGAPVTYDGFAGEDGCDGGYAHLKNQQHHQEAGQTQKHHLETAPMFGQTWHSTTYMADVATYQLTLTSLHWWWHCLCLWEYQGIQSSISGGPDASCQQRKATPATLTTTLITFHTRAYPTCNHSCHMTCTWTSLGTTNTGGFHFHYQHNGVLFVSHQSQSAGHNKLMDSRKRILVSECRCRLY